MSSFSIETILQKNKVSTSSPMNSADSTSDGNRFKFDPRLATLQLVSPSPTCTSILLPFMGQTAKMPSPFSPSTPIQPSPPGICLQPMGYGACRDPRIMPYPLASPGTGLATLRRCSRSDESPLGSPELPGDLKKRKKKRTAFSSHQLKRLEDKFSTQKYLSKVDRCELAVALGLSERHVKTWYQNRRTKWKKECCESDWSKQREAAAAIMYMQHLDMNTKKPGTDSSSEENTD